MNPKDQGRYFLPCHLIIDDGQALPAERRRVLRQQFAAFQQRAWPGFLGVVPVYDSLEVLERNHPRASYMTFQDRVELHAAFVLCASAEDYPTGTVGLFLVFDTYTDLLAQFPGNPEFFTADLMPLSESGPQNNLPSGKTSAPASKVPGLNALLSESQKYRARHTGN